MQKTRLRLMLDYPFFGSLALTLDHKEDRTISTCCTDGKSLRYNPLFISSLTPNEKLFLYLHEICHIILGHSVRRKTRDPKLWNIAGDHAVNLLLRDSIDLPRPEGGLCNHDYIGLSAEQIYKKLNEEFPDDIRNNTMPPPDSESGADQTQEQAQEQSQEQASDEQNQDESPGGESDEAGQYPTDEPPLPFDEEGEQSYAEQMARAIDNINSAIREQESASDEQSEDINEASGNSEEEDESEESQGEANNTNRDRMDRIERYNEMVGTMERFGMVEDPDEELGLTESDIQSTTSLIDRMLNNSNVETPEPIRRLIRQFISTKIPWTELLARFIHNSCEQQYNWSTPNRRYASVTNVILPGLKSQSELSIAVVVDTSGSIDDNLLNLFMSELTSLMNSIEYSKIHMISCSHRVFEPQSFNKGDQLMYQPTGEGETKFAPAFEHINTIDPPPACVIYFTDLFSDDFGVEPEMPVLWIGKYNDEWLTSHRVRVPFGEIITMHEEEDN